MCLFFLKKHNMEADVLQMKKLNIQDTSLLRYAQNETNIVSHIVL